MLSGTTWRNVNKLTLIFHFSSFLTGKNPPDLSLKKNLAANESYCNFGDSFHVFKAKYHTGEVVPEISSLIRDRRLSKHLCYL